MGVLWWWARHRIDALPRRIPYLDLLLVERHALHDVETRCFVGFGIGIIRRFEYDFVFRAGTWGREMG